jgi:hypothetical protein
VPSTSTATAALSGATVSVTRSPSPSTTARLIPAIGATGVITVQAADGETTGPPAA